MDCYSLEPDVVSSDKVMLLAINKLPKKIVHAFRFSCQ